MIKVTTSESKSENEVDFPKLMISDEGSIVFMYESKRGIQLDDGDNSSGFYSEAWNMHVFTDYNEPLTLQNVVSES